MKKKLETFEFYYCKDCELILFKWNKRVSHHGLSFREFNAQGFEEETDFDCKETDVWEVECPECGTEIDEKVEVPIELVLEIMKRLNKNSDDTVSGIHLNPKFVEDFDPMKAKEILFESLL